MELKVINEYNAYNGGIKWNTEYPSGTLDKYKKLVTSNDPCMDSSGVFNEIPEDMANLDFANNTSCLISNIMKDHNYTLLHATIENKEVPIKKEDLTHVLVMSGSLPGINDLFIVKSQPYDDLMTEYLVGRKLNELRAEIPNFALVYGLFDCSSPVANAIRVGSWCISQNNPTGYMVYENVKGMTFTRWMKLKTSTAEDLIKILFQIFMAVYIAHQRCKFTHYDLHSGNVIIHQLPEVRSITYPGNITIQTDKLAVIIDYGLSHINDNGISVGRMEYQHASIFYDMDRPMYDVYRILNSVIIAGKGRQDLYDAIRPMWNLIIKDKPEDFFNYRNVEYLPLQADNRIMLIDEFLGRVIASYNILSTPGPKELEYTTKSYKPPIKDYTAITYTTLDNILNLSIPQLLRNAETFIQIEEALLDDISTMQYFDQIITIAHNVMKYREVIWYITSKIVQPNEEIRQAILSASRRIAIINAALNEDYHKIHRLKIYNPDFFNVLSTDTRELIIYKKNIKSSIVDVLLSYIKQ
jgi:serine/threonine protein kinase